MRIVKLGLRSIDRSTSLVAVMASRKPGYHLTLTLSAGTSRCLPRFSDPFSYRFELGRIIFSANVQKGMFRFPMTLIGAVDEKRRTSPQSRRWRSASSSHTDFDTRKRLMIHLYKPEQRTNETCKFHDQFRKKLVACMDTGYQYCTSLYL